MDVALSAAASGTTAPMCADPVVDRALRRARAGDVQAFEELYRATVGRIHALCLRMSGDPHLAEELTQESYLVAWRKLATFRGESAFSTWLHRVAVNVVLGHRRTRDRRRERVVEELDAAVQSPTAEVAHPGTTVDLERAISKLPERARTVFVLHDIEGFRHREIARLAGMAEGTSKAQLSRARRLLRKALSS
jgi:RNA polymerase sigma-70 factor (ECF subfamily)